MTVREMRPEKKKKKRNSTVSKVVRISRIRFVSVFWIPEQVRTGKFCFVGIGMGAHEEEGRVVVALNALGCCR